MRSIYGSGKLYYNGEEEKVLNCERTAKEIINKGYIEQ